MNETETTISKVFNSILLREAKKDCVVLRWAYSFMNTIMINDWRYAQKTKNITLEMNVWQANHMVLFVAYERSNVFLCVHEQYTRFVWFFRRMYEIVRALMISFIQILKSPICQSWALKNGNVHDYFILATNGRKQEKKKRERYVSAQLTQLYDEIQAQRSNRMIDTTWDMLITC